MIRVSGFVSCVETRASIGGMRPKQAVASALAYWRLARRGWDDPALNVRTSARSRVHAVTADEAGRGVPACNVGVGGWDATRMLPTCDEIDCARCLHLARRAAAENTDGSSAAAGQAPLWLDGTDSAAGVVPLDEDRYTDTR